ncbi:MAG: hypothetical protein M3303_13125 [Gemmatimonadota bacterium]|nr:hypothetical protein [Gemmatimonadota bacterium]
METDPTDPLVPELREAERMLETTLEEACATPPASKADTGELIHVDELLELASDAAKRAISLRRRRGADRTQRAERTSMGDVEAAASADATHRTFVDARGVQWDVFAVYPEARLSVHSQLKGTYPQGWLCFDSASEKRRLSPIPQDWQTMSDEQLRQLAEQAEAAASRRSRKSGPEQTRPSE